MTAAPRLVPAPRAPLPAAVGSVATDPTPTGSPGVPAVPDGDAGAAGQQAHVGLKVLSQQTTACSEHPQTPL